VFNAFTAIDAQTKIDVKRDIETATGVRRRVTVVPVEIEFADLDKLKRKLVFFAGPPGVDLSVEFDPSSSIRGFSQSASIYDVFHNEEDGEWGLERVRNPDDVIDRFCIADNADHCPSDFVPISDCRDITNAISKATNSRHLTFLVVNPVLTTNFTFNFNVSANITAISSVPAQISLTIQAFCCDLSLTNVLVSINGSFGSIETGSLSLTNSTFAPPIAANLTVMNLDTDLVSYRRLVADTRNFWVSALRVRDFPGRVVKLEPDRFVFENMTVPQRTRLTLTFSISHDLEISCDDATGTFHHELHIVSTCDMGYRVSGIWPKTFSGIVFTNLRGKLTLDCERAPLAIVEFDDNAVVVLERDVLFDRPLDLRAPVSFIANEPHTLTVQDVIIESSHRIKFSNVRAHIGSLSHVGGRTGVLPAAEVGSLTVRQPAIIEAQELVFAESESVLSLSFALHARTFIRLDASPSINITVVGSPHPWILGRQIEVLCAARSSAPPKLVTVNASRVLTTRWRTAGQDLCLAVVFENHQTDDSSDFYFDDEDDGVIMFISAWTLAGVALGLLGVLLWVCWNKNRANRPGAFEQVADRTAIGPEEVIQIDDIDEDVL
jgi:hypothetical protein